MNVEMFGRDHWSLLAYIETCCVDSRGRLSLARMRVNSAKRDFGNGSPVGWSPTYGTRIKSGISPDHDDLDCLEDLEKAGFLHNIGTLINPVAEMTDKGMKASAALRAHKMKGGQFATFEYKEDVGISDNELENARRWRGTEKGEFLHEGT